MKFTEITRSRRCRSLVCPPKNGMGKSGGAPKKPKAAPKAVAPAAPLKAQGTTTKRTPTSAFDGAAGKDTAGKMHGDLQKSAKDSTLEHSLFAAFNTD